MTKDQALDWLAWGIVLVVVAAFAITMVYALFAWLGAGAVVLLWFCAVFCWSIIRLADKAVR